MINDTSDRYLDSLRNQLRIIKSGHNQDDDGDGSGNNNNNNGKRRRRRKIPLEENGRRDENDEDESKGIENHRPKKRVRKSKDDEDDDEVIINGDKDDDEVVINQKKANSKQNRKNNKNLVGLRNLGNTCFMSAVLQSLGNIHEFCRVLKDLPTLELKNNADVKRETRNNPVVQDGAIMTEELRKVLVALNSSDKAKKSAISPEALFHVIWKVVPRFRGYQQQDAHEFLRYMLDRLHTELLALLPGDLAFLQKNISPYSRRVKGLTKSSQSLVTSVFGGMLQSEVSCLVCKTSSKKHDPFLDLSIDIPNQFIQYRKSKGGDNEERPKCQLHGESFVHCFFFYKH